MEDRDVIVGGIAIAVLTVLLLVFAGSADKRLDRLEAAQQKTASWASCNRDYRLLVQSPVDSTIAKSIVEGREPCAAISWYPEGR